MKLEGDNIFDINNSIIITPTSTPDTSKSVIGHKLFQAISSNDIEGSFHIIENYYADDRVINYRNKV